MKAQKSIRHNFMMNIILTMSSFIFPLITFPYISRILLPEGTGKVSFATSIVTYFAMIAQLGIPTYGIRACAKVRDCKDELTKTVQEIFIINLVMTVITYIVFIICLLNIPRLEQEKMLFLIISLTIVLNTIGMEWLYKALEQYTYITIRSVIFKFIAIIAMLLLVHQESDYVIYGAISIFASSASNICNFFNIHRYIDFGFVNNYNFKRHFKAIFIFFSMACATTIYVNLDNLMIGIMKSNTEVGYYNAAVKIRTVLLSIVTSIGTVLLPRASYYVEQNLKDDFLRMTGKALNFVFLLSAPVVVYFIFFAKEAIYFLSGVAYEGAIQPMQVIMPTVFFAGLTNIMGLQMLIPMGKEKMVLYSEIAGAIADFIINLVLIPRIASLGAAIGTVIAEMVVWVVQYIALKDVLMEMYKEIKYQAVSSGILMGITGCFWIKRLDLGSFMTLMISAIIFFGLYAMVLTIMKEPLVLEFEHQLLRKLSSIIDRKRRG